jgi:hypothetical protein
MGRLHRLAGMSVVLGSFAAASWAQEHPCEAEFIVPPGGGEKAFHRECCGQRPYQELTSVAAAQGIRIARRGVAQQATPGYFWCRVDLEWEQHLDAWRRDNANFQSCVAKVKEVIGARNRSAKDTFYNSTDIQCGTDRDKFLCAIGNAYACK